MSEQPRASEAESSNRVTSPSSRPRSLSPATVGNFPSQIRSRPRSESWQRVTTMALEDVARVDSPVPYMSPSEKVMKAVTILVKAMIQDHIPEDPSLLFQLDDKQHGQVKEESEDEVATEPEADESAPTFPQISRRDNSSVLPSRSLASVSSVGLSSSSVSSGLRASPGSPIRSNFSPTIRQGVLPSGSGLTQARSLPFLSPSLSTQTLPRVQVSPSERPTDSTSTRAFAASPTSMGFPSTMPFFSPSVLKDLSTSSKKVQMGGTFDSEGYATLLELLGSAIGDFSRMKRNSDGRERKERERRAKEETIEKSGNVSRRAADLNRSNGRTWNGSRFGSLPNLGMGGGGIPLHLTTGSPLGRRSSWTEGVPLGAEQKAGADEEVEGKDEFALPGEQLLEEVSSLLQEVIKRLDSNAIDVQDTATAESQDGNSTFGPRALGDTLYPIPTPRKSSTGDSSDWDGATYYARSSSSLSTTRPLPPFKRSTYDLDKFNNSPELDDAYPPKHQANRNFPPPIFRLPPELIARVFKECRNVETPAPPDPTCGLGGIMGRGPDPYLFGPPSRTSCQSQVHDLALICKRWEPIARQVAYSTLHLRKRAQISKLVNTLSSSDGERLASHVQEVNVKIAGVGSESVGLGLGMLRGNRRRHGGGAFAWLHGRGGGSNFLPGSPGSNAQIGSDESSGQVLSKLLALTKNASTLEVYVSPNMLSHGGYVYGAEFLEASLMDSLCGLHSLKSFTMRQCIEFGELEELIRQVPTLQELHLEGGIDNIDGRGDLDNPEPHRARLSSFQCSNFDVGFMSSRQLCWILQASVGTLKHLDLLTYSGNPVWGLGPGGAGGPNNTTAPFATKEFADILCDLAPTLERLALRDSHGTGTIDPTLRNEPHNASLDYAVSKCTNLTELAMEWCFTGAGFLDALPPEIESIMMYGAPVTTAAPELIDRLEGTSGHGFKKLQTLLLASFPFHQGTDWTSYHIRKLRLVCHRRNCTFAFAGTS